MIEDSENVYRFVFEEKSYIRGDLTVKHRAFMPKAGTTSVMRVQQLAHEARLAHCAEHIAPLRGKDGVGYVEVEAGYIRGVELDVVSSEPPPLHANITGWPTEDQIDAIKVRATYIATNARYFRA